MPFRFRQTIRLLPGIRLNLSKTGASLSLGRRGATVNINRHGHKTTVGLPGSGMSYETERTPFGKDSETFLPSDASSKPDKTGGLDLLRRLFGRLPS